VRAGIRQPLDAAGHELERVDVLGPADAISLNVVHAELRDRARALAGRFLAAGLKTHDRIGLVAETDADFVTAFFACQYARLTPTPLPLPAPLGGREAYVEQIARMLGSAKAAAVFGPESLLPWLREAADAAGVKMSGQIADLPDAAPADLPAEIEPA
jgi:fatty-acyl-CoA synthase